MNDQTVELLEMMAEQQKQIIALSNIIRTLTEAQSIATTTVNGMLDRLKTLEEQA